MTFPLAHISSIFFKAHLRFSMALMNPFIYNMLILMSPWWTYYFLRNIFFLRYPFVVDIFLKSPVYRTFNWTYVKLWLCKYELLPNLQQIKFNSATSPNALRSKVRSLQLLRTKFLQSNVWIRIVHSRFYVLL